MGDELDDPLGVRSSSIEKEYRRRALRLAALERALESLAPRLQQLNVIGEFLDLLYSAPADLQRDVLLAPEFLNWCNTLHKYVLTWGNSTAKRWALQYHLQKIRTLATPLISFNSADKELDLYLPPSGHLYIPYYGIGVLLPTRPHVRTVKVHIAKEYVVLTGLGIEVGLKDRGGEVVTDGCRVIYWPKLLAGPTVRVASDWERYSNGLALVHSHQEQIAVPAPSPTLQRVWDDLTSESFRGDSIKDVLSRAIAVINAPSSHLNPTRGIVVNNQDSSKQLRALFVAAIRESFSTDEERQNKPGADEGLLVERLAYRNALAAKNESGQVVVNLLRRLTEEKDYFRAGCVAFILNRYSEAVEMFSRASDGPYHERARDMYCLSLRHLGRIKEFEDEMFNSHDSNQS